MRFIKLEILNLASLDRKEGETIHFEEGALGKSAIFSIVGPTGSGKSTILDAICLALYNRAPRYPRKKNERLSNYEIFGDKEEGENNRLGANDPRNILTRGKKHGYSKLTFRAGNGAVYRAEWSVSKKTKNYENARTGLYKITVKNGVPVEEEEKWERLPQIIGLDYEQFLRTVLIAQGSFSSFIKATTDERCELLEKILGCEDLYTSIADGIKQEKGKAEEAHARIAAEFSAQETDLIPEEELDAVKTRIKDLEDKEMQAKAELLKVSEAIGWYTTDENLIRNIATSESKFGEAKKQMEAMREQADRLALHDAALPAAALYQEMKAAEADIAECTRILESLRQEIDAKDKEIKAGEEELKSLAEKVRQTSDFLEKQRPHINKARELKAELKAVEKTLAEKKAAKAAAEAAKDQADKDAAGNEAAIGKAAEALQRSRQERLALADELKAEGALLAAAAEEALACYARENARLESCDPVKIQEEKADAEKARQDLLSAIRIQAALKDKRTRRETCVKDTARLSERNSAIEKELEAIDIDSLRAEWETLDKTFTLMTSENWEMHRAGLSEDGPCPLCGAVHHPYREKSVFAAAAEDMKRLVGQKRKQLEEQHKAMQALSSELAKNKGFLKGIEATLMTLDTETDALGKEWEVLRKTRPDWPADVEDLRALQAGTDREAELARKRLDACNELVSRVNELRKKKEAAEKTWQEYEKTSMERKQEADGKVTDAETRWTAEKAKTENLKSRQTEKREALADAAKALDEAEKETLSRKAALEQEIGGRDPDLYEQELEQARSAASGAERKKTEALSLLRERLKELSGKDSTLKDRKEAQTGIMGQKNAALAVWLAGYNDGKETPLTQEVLARLCASTDNWEEIRKETERRKNECTASWTTLSNARKALQEHQVHKPDKQKEELLALKAGLENRPNDELVSFQVRLKRHEAAKQRMGNMFGLMQEAEALKQDWKEISDSVGGDGKTLRKIAQCYTLRFLIEHANAEIRKFNSRYELMQVKNSLGIRVIDHDRADDIRDTTSLSGGETFIVSLGLALGLSALSSRNIGFENLFIDEGFGTLDPDTLDTVIDSLSMLQTSQGKKVGVISHTDAMSERITTQIRVVKNGRSGSSHIEIHPSPAVTGSGGGS